MKKLWNDKSGISEGENNENNLNSEILFQVYIEKYRMLTRKRFINE
jgi:hypothetical protein